MGMGQTALILAVQPDSVQAVTLRYALRERVNGEVIVVHSTEAALSVIDKQVPDVILLHALMLPAEEDYLIAYLRTLPNTDHVQAITIPQLTSSSDCDRPKHSLLGRLKQGPTRMDAVGCDSRLFAADVVGYLTRAREIEQQIHERKAEDEPLGSSDRRGWHRWSPLAIPWVSSVQLIAGEQAELIDVSLSGALVRTHIRPALPSVQHLDLDSRARPGLTFHLVSGAEVRAIGRVVRCHVGSLGGGPIRYDVAFRFDESVGLDLPTVMPPAADAGDNVMMSLAIACVPPEARTHVVHEVLNHSVTLQNELLARLEGAGSLPNSLRAAVSELTTVNAALVDIRSTLLDAHRTRSTDAELSNLGDRLAPRIRELHALRSVVVESISRDDLALIAPQANRSQPSLVELQGSDPCGPVRPRK
jgi:hypothetical protein